MKVAKKELVERSFIPYEIIITVESEQEHNDLKYNIHELSSIIRKPFSLIAGISKRGSGKDALEKLLDHISKHTK